MGLFLQNVIKGRKQSRQRAELLLLPLPPLRQSSPVQSSLELLSHQAISQSKTFETSWVILEDKIVLKSKATC